MNLSSRSVAAIILSPAGAVNDGAGFGCPSHQHASHGGSVVQHAADCNVAGWWAARSDARRSDGGEARSGTFPGVELGILGFQYF